MSKGIFITGTDTGVGKTIVSAAIIRALTKKGLKVGAMKPLETGCSVGVGVEDLIPADGMFLREMAEMDDSINLVTPIRFEQPLAPMVASEIEGRSVELKKIFGAYQTLSKKYDFMVVEGVGGLLVPITLVRQSDSAAEKEPSVYFVSDLMKGLKLPIIIVARPTLGTINHTLLTVNHALREGIEVLGVIINYSRPPENDIAEKTNPSVLRKLCPVPVLFEVPFVEDISVKGIDSIEMPHSVVDAIYG